MTTDEPHDHPSFGCTAIDQYQDWQGQFAETLPTNCFIVASQVTNHGNMDSGSSGGASVLVPADGLTKAYGGHAPSDPEYTTALAENNTPSGSNSCGKNGLSQASSTPRQRRVAGERPFSCTHHGCPWTFGRRYELRRHEKNVHNRNFALLCPVYGCNRAEKPFPRTDKLKEQMRKHQDANRFLCIVEECRVGPFTSAQLKEHLQVQHNLHFGAQKDIDAVLKAAGLRLTMLRNGTSMLDDCVDCPLRFLGCKFREAKTNPANDALPVQSSSMVNHLNAHKLSELSKGYEVIVASCGSWPLRCSSGSCPMCQNRPYAEGDTVIEMADFTQHILEHHSKKERAAYMLELTEMFRPFLEKKEKSWAYSKSKDMDDFCEELETAIAFF
jgi:hypothetical protein